MSQDSTAFAARIERLFIYPVKSCAPLEVTESTLVETGLDLDRTWMVVDENGEFVTQRELARMTLIRPQLKWDQVILRAPGMLSLHLQVNTVEEPCQVRIWGDSLPAYDMGPVAAQWFSDFLGRPLRLVRFDPEQRRLSSRKWTGDAEALNQFSDGYPILVAGSASLALLNEKLAARGRAPVGIERFRPNIVLSGLEAHDEDRAGLLRIATGEGQSVQLRLVKPCPRCPIPNIDPASAAIDATIGDTLQTYRRDPRLDGAVSFGMNAIVEQGFEQKLRVGQEVSVEIAFA